MPMPMPQPSEKISAELLMTMKSLTESLWPIPSELPTVKETRRHLANELDNAVVTAVWQVWRHDIPASKEKAVARRVRHGIRVSFDFLRSKNSESLWLELKRIPPYWEPPVVDSEPPTLAPHMRQLYCLTAAFIALCIRNVLEDFHIEHHSDEHMPQLNRAIRNTVYRVLLANPSHTWNISTFSQVAIQMAMVKQPGYELPPVAGDAK